MTINKHLTVAMLTRYIFHYKLLLFCPICPICLLFVYFIGPLFSNWMLWTGSSNRSTAPWRPRVFFSSCSLQVQWSRYLCIFVFMYLCLCWFSLIQVIQDRALVASKHLLVETEDKNLADYTLDPAQAHAVGPVPCSMCSAIRSTLNSPKYAPRCTAAGCRCIGPNGELGLRCMNNIIIG